MYQYYTQSTVADSEGAQLVPHSSVASILVLGGGGARPPNVPTTNMYLYCASERSERAPQKHIFCRAPNTSAYKIPVADLRGGGGGGGLALGLPSKNLMCIEKRHHNMSRPTQYVPIALCLRLSLRQ